MKRLYTLLIAFIVIIFASQSAKAQNIISHNEMDSCGGKVFFTFTVDAANPALSYKMFFGDGDSLVGTLPTGKTVGQNHGYVIAGTYTVRHILYLSGVPIDTVQFSFTTNCSYAFVRLYSDNNSNCTRDTGEPFLSLASLVEVDSSGVKIDTLNIYGTSGRKFTTGKTYSFKLLNPPLGTAATCPTSGIITVTIPTTTLATYIDFGIQCGTTTAFDLGVYVSAFYRPVSTSWMHIQAYNSSCSTMNGVLTVNISPKYNYSSASITPTSVSGKTLTWNLTGLSASVSKFISVLLTPATTLSVGDTVCYNVSITPTSGDVNTANNTFSRCDSVRASYDPNEKNVLPTGNIMPGTKLTYTIHFENMGNDTAFNIYILDTLSSHLDAGSLVVLQSSHSVTSNVQDIGGKHIARFEFADINLADKNAPLFNKGFVTFSINSKSTLAPSTWIYNKAGIYFDINPPIITNTAENMTYPVSVPVILQQTDVAVYPNPANDKLTIDLKDNKFNQAVIINTLGQVMMEENINSNITTLSIKHLVPGIYQLVLKGEEGVKVMKVEKQ